MGKKHKNNYNPGQSSTGDHAFPCTETGKEYIKWIYPQKCFLGASGWTKFHQLKKSQYRQTSHNYGRTAYC